MNKRDEKRLRQLETNVLMCVALAQSLTLQSPADPPFTLARETARLITGNKRRPMRGKLLKHIALLETMKSAALAAVMEASQEQNEPPPGS